MAIFNNTVIPGQLATATQHNNLNSDGNNTSDNVHPQYLQPIIDGRRWFMSGFNADPGPTNINLVHDDILALTDRDVDFGGSYTTHSLDRKAAYAFAFDITGHLSKSPLNYIFFKAGIAVKIDIQIDIQTLITSVDQTTNAGNSIWYEVYKVNDPSGNTALKLIPDKYTLIQSGESSRVASSIALEWDRKTLVTDLALTGVVANDIILVLAKAHTYTPVNNDSASVSTTNFIITPKATNSN